jgi:diguanylate cyclase (GGDEF)-like protein
MPQSGVREVALVGRRIKQKILAALTLSSIIPLLILAYVFYTYIFPLLDPIEHEVIIAGLQVLILFAGLLVAGGCYVIWDVITAVVRLAEIITSPSKARDMGTRADEIGAMMSSFARMTNTIEQQAAEINAFAAQLDSAYKELEGANVRLKEYSFKDEVTGLYNRRFFSIRLEEEISRYRRFSHPVSIVLLDLDGFKEINDELGHAAGDQTLREIAQLLLKQSRGINVIARYGGDEFSVLLVETTKAGARLYAERMRQAISALPFSHGRRMTASFGIANVPEDISGASEEMIRAADDALYAAKRAGKNQVATYDVAVEKTTGFSEKAG